MNKLKWAAFTMLALLFADICISIIMFAGSKDKMYIVSAEEVLKIVDPLEYQKRLEELVEEADG